MLLTGSFLRTLDEKQRIAVPKELRAALGKEESAELYVAPGTDGSLGLYAFEAFEQLARRLAEAPSAGGDVRAFGRLFYAQARRVELDAQGRVRIPPELAEWAELKGEVMLLGVGDHIELWDAERWKAYVAGHQARYDQLSEAALARSSSGPAPGRA